MTTYILDPVCVQEQGHNYTAIKRYANYLRKLDDEIVCVVGKALPERLTTEDLGVSWVRFFSHYYIQFIPVKTPDEKSRKVQSLQSSERCQYLEGLSREEFSRFVNDFNVGHRDAVFYPSIDYFSLVGLIDVLKKLRPSEAPNVLIRWIAVMENNICNCKRQLEDLMEELRELKNQGHRITHSCESSSYARYLGEYIEEDAIVTPTLVEDDWLDYPDNDTFTIAFPGAGRLDKGFSRIHNIVDKIHMRVPVRALAQMLSGAEFEGGKECTKAMVNDSRVVLLPAVISETTMKKVFKSSNLVVAPYDKKVYKYRSSAIMAEAAMYGRPLVATPDSGFSEEIKELGIGDLAETDDEIADKVISHTRKTYEEMKSESAKVRGIFESFTLDSYDKFFEAIRK